jgi:hypothetical protein
VTKAEILRRAWRYAARSHPQIEGHEWGHRYVEIVRWASNSKAFLNKGAFHIDKPTD